MATTECPWRVGLISAVARSGTVAVSKGEVTLTSFDRQHLLAAHHVVAGAVFDELQPVEGFVGGRIGAGREVQGRSTGVLGLGPVPLMLQGASPGRPGHSVS